MSKITDAEANATSLDGLVNDNALVPTLRNGPKPSYQYLVDGWNTEFNTLIDNLDTQGDAAIVAINEDVATVESLKNSATSLINSDITTVDNAATVALSSINTNKETIETAAANVDLTIAELDSKYKLTMLGVDGAWASGIEFTAYNQYLVYNGTAYQPKPSTNLPYTTGAIPNLSDVQPITVNNADGIILDGGGSVQDFINKTQQFKTVAEAKSYSKVESLLGYSVMIVERGCEFTVVESSTVTVNEIGEIESSHDSQYAFQVSDKGDLYAHNLGFAGGDFLNLQPILEYCMSEKLNLKVKKDNYTMSAGQIRWNPTITVDFCGSYVLCELGAKILNKYIETDAGSTNSYDGNRCYFKNLRIEGAGRAVVGSNVWSQGNTESLTGGRDFSRCGTDNIQVLECNPSLEINTYNTYLVTNNNTMLERGETLIQVNDGGVNSGENFKFTGNGIFAVCDDVLVLNEACDISFIGSSFDFVQGNPVVFNSGYCYIKHVGCYYEKATKNGFARSSGSYFNSVLMLTDPIVLAREYDGYAQNSNAGNNKIFTGTNVLYKCDGLRIKRELYNADPSDYDLCGDEIQQIKLTNVMRDQFRGQCLGPKFSTNLNSDFDLAANGDGIATTGVDGFVDSNIAGGYDWTIQNLVFYTSDKAAEVTLDGVTKTFCDVLTTRISCKTNESLVLATKLHGGNSTGNVRVNSTVRFYDVNNNLIDTQTLNHGNMADYYSDTNSPIYTGGRDYWIGIPSLEINSIPQGADSCDVKLTLSQFTNTIYIDDICVNVYS